ncbi:MAG: 2Fe-2S iron-sulfur cluster binding domain-containing protein [Spirochaetales bacterium]|nr:MAG: 2Fe-2S iron-sulfur cluster binding domain-containing protein [Spirochaetales bacterium]
MSWMPLIIMNLILLAITLLLALAARLLVTYGKCTIKVKDGDETREFAVEGGGTLLSALTEQGVKISSSCGGKGSCGYCKAKVVSGAGQILPTEEIYMSRAEKLDGIRLACQVKVKTDMEIEMPDFLEIVRKSAQNKTFDATRRWLVTVN